MELESHRFERVASLVWYVRLLRRPPEGLRIGAGMQRVDGFAGGKEPDEGWVVVKVKLRPSWAAALRAEATRESKTLHRKVYVSDLVRDALRAFMIIRRVFPARRPRFRPSPDSEQT